MNDEYADLYIDHSSLGLDEPKYRGQFVKLRELSPLARKRFGLNGDTRFVLEGGAPKKVTARMIVEAEYRTTALVHRGDGNIALDTMGAVFSLGLSSLVTPQVYTGERFYYWANSDTNTRAGGGAIRPTDMRRDINDVEPAKG